MMDNVTNITVARLTLLAAVFFVTASAPLLAGQAVMSGGGTAGSENFSARCGIGQTIAGRSSSETYGASCGYLETATGGESGHLCGDADGSATVDIDDVAAIVAYIFTGGEAPDPLQAGDTDCSGYIDIDDVVCLIEFIFNGGPAPCSNCGGEPPVAKTAPGSVDLIVGHDRQKSISNVSVSLESDAEIQAIQLEFEIPGSISDVRVSSDLHGVSMFHGTSNARLKIGLLDLRGKLMIPSDCSELLKLSHQGDEAIELIESIVIRRGGGKLDVTVKRSSDSGLIPERYALRHCVPNPFNPTTEISFTLPMASNVRIDVFNILGQKVRTLVDGILPAGEHSVTWDGNSDSGVMLASGVYFYRMQAGAFTDTKKMVMLK